MANLKDLVKRLNLFNQLSAVKQNPTQFFSDVQARVAEPYLRSATFGGAESLPFIGKNFQQQTRLKNTFGRDPLATGAAIAGGLAGQAALGKLMGLATRGLAPVANPLIGATVSSGAPQALRYATQNPALLGSATRLANPLLSRMTQGLATGIAGGIGFSVLQPKRTIKENVSQLKRNVALFGGAGAVAPALVGPARAITQHITRPFERAGGKAVAAISNFLKAHQGKEQKLVDSINAQTKSGVFRSRKEMDFRNWVNDTLVRPRKTPVSVEDLKIATKRADDLALKKLKSGAETHIGLTVRDINKDISQKGTVGIDIPTVQQMSRKLSPLVEKATKQGKLPTQLPPQQPPMDGNITSPPGVPSSPGSISDPVNKIIQALKETKPIRGQQQKLYSQELAKRTARIAGVGQRVPGEQGYFAQLGQLKGQLPKAQFEGVRSKLTQNDIDSLFNQVESANITPFEKINAKTGLANLLGKEGGQVPTKSELSLLNDIFPPEFVQTILSKRSGWQKFLQGAGDVLSVPRSLMASFDLSAPLRQGALIGPSHPKEYGRAFGSMFKYFGSEKAYQGMIQDIQVRPTYQAMRQSGLALTGKSSPILTEHEEIFMSSLAEKLPIIKYGVRASNRAYTGFLNKLRADVFDTLYKNAQKEGIATPEVTASIAKFVNTATGRGDLGALNRAGCVLSTALFSPRLLASRINTLNPMYYTSLEPFARKEALKALFTFATTATTVLGLAKLGGDSVGVDPRNADFGKIKFGNTRYDILAGFQQPIRTASQLLTGKLISSTTGKEYTLGEGYKPLTRKDIALRFLESKESPVASFITQLLQGTNAIGQPFDLSTEAVDRFIPMVWQDVYDLIKEKDSPLAGLLATPAIFGVGTQTYGKQIPNIETTPTGKTTIKLRPVPGLGEDIISKITGRQYSNVPLNQQQAIVDAKSQEFQNQILKEKAKKQLGEGKIPTDLQSATFTIDGSDYEGFSTGKDFIYTDNEGEVKTKSIKDIEKAQIKDDKSLFDAEFSLTKDRLTRVGDSEGIAELNQIKLEYYKEYKSKLDPKKDAKELITIQNAIEDLEYSITKGKKGKKPKKISIKTTQFKAPKSTIKLSKAKAPTLRLKKSPTFKISRPKGSKLTLSYPIAKAPKFKIKPYRNTFTGGQNILA